MKIILDTNVLVSAVFFEIIARLINVKYFAPNDK